MRIGVLADAHGNLAALEAVMSKLQDAAPDVIVNLGDLVSGPFDPAGSAEAQMLSGHVKIAGNHERQLLAGGIGAFDVVARPLLSEQHWAWMGIGDARPVLCGHTHTPRLVTVGGVLVVNPGSVGMPCYRDGPLARYAIVERRASGWSAELHGVPYDYEIAARQAEAFGFPNFAFSARTGRIMDA